MEAILGVVLTTTSSRSKDYCPKKQLTTQLRDREIDGKWTYHQIRDREIDGKPISPRGKDCCPKNADFFMKNKLRDGRLLIRSRLFLGIMVY